MTPLARTILLLGVLALAPSLAHANIGETLSQLRARYGSAKEVGGQMLFQRAGYSICVYFDGDRSAMEIFCRDGSVKDKLDITQQDIDKILQAEGDGMAWSPLQTTSGKQTWIRSDNKLLARFTSGPKPEDRFVTIMANEK